MICHRCSQILPHDLAHVREHEMACDGNSVEEFLSRFASLADSIARMARAGADPLGHRHAWQPMHHFGPDGKDFGPTGYVLCEECTAIEWQEDETT